MGRFGSLRGKIIGRILLVVALFMSSIFLALVFMNRAQTMRRFEDLTARMGELIAIGLENGMLDRDLSGVRQMTNSLAEHEEVEGIYIIDKNGRVRISSDDASVDRRFDIKSETCQICHRVSPESRGRSVIFNRDGKRVFRSVTPIANKPRCHPCHAPEQKLNGVLIADFSMEAFDRETKVSLVALVAAVAGSIFGLAAVIWHLLDRKILRRLSKFLRSVRSISSGNLSERIGVEGNDEISELEESFNTMSANLQASIAEVRHARDSLESFINSIEDEILVIDKDFRIVNANRAALSRLNLDENEIIGRPCHEVCYNEPNPCREPKRDCPVQYTFSTGISSSATRSFAAEGETRHFEQYVSPVRNENGEVAEAVKISRDVTRRHRLEEQLMQAERLISLGQLAAGVAHQINNPIGIIVNRIDCIKRESRSGNVPDSLQSDLGVMLDCAWRVSEITQSLLTFSREAPLIMEFLDVNKALMTAVDLVRMQIVKKNVHFHTKLQKPLPLIKGDLNKLEQCFVNILNNAVDAIAEAGSVTVESYVDPEDEGRVCVKISDTGPGIGPEYLGKIFDPFFTTKGVGKGTGLGLSISYGIVRKHGGRLEVSSISGKGATFFIRLPIKGEAETNV